MPGAGPSSPLTFEADEAAQINRLKFQAARGYKGQEMLHLPGKLLFCLSRRDGATYRRGEMPEFILRTTTEQTEGSVYQHGSLNPSSGGHVIQRSSKHWTRSRGEKVQAPSFPWSNPAASGKPHPTLLSCSSYMWTRETLLSTWTAVEDTTALFWRRRGAGSGAGTQQTLNCSARIGPGPRVGRETMLRKETQTGWAAWHRHRRRKRRRITRGQG